MRKRVLLGLGLGAALLGSTATARAAVYFDPTGTGTFGAETLTSFDWAPGNSIARNGNQAVTNFATNQAIGSNLPVTFDYFYQARLQAYTLSDFSTNLMGTGKELTIVGGISEKVTGFTGSVGTAGAIATFDLAPGYRFLEIYYDGTAATQAGGSVAGHANNLAGQGFNDGQLILKALITDVNPTTFTLLANQPAGGVNLDQTVDGDEYPTINTVQGNGSTTVYAQVVASDANFFQFDPSGPAVIQLSLLQNVGLDLPFNSVDPSSGFVVNENGTGIGTAGPAPDLTIGPDNVAANNSVGTLNGGPIGSGGDTDIVFQTDTNQTFSSVAVPEPVTASLTTIGLAGLALVALRRRGN